MCTICDTCGGSVRGGSKAVETHYKKYHKPNICEDCGLEVKGYAAYHEHKRHCGTRTCSNCMKEITRKSFARHSKQCKGDNAEEFSCDQCNYKTIRKADLKK